MTKLPCGVNIFNIQQAILNGMNDYNKANEKQPHFVKIDNCFLYELEVWR